MAVAENYTTPVQVHNRLNNLTAPLGAEVEAVSIKRDEGSPSCVFRVRKGRLSAMIEIFGTTASIGWSDAENLMSPRFSPALKRSQGTPGASRLYRPDIKTTVMEYLLLEGLRVEEPFAS